MARAVAAVAALLVAGCTSDGGDQGAAPGGSKTSTTSTTDPRLVDRPPVAVHDCWWELPDDLPDDLTVTCGTIAPRADPTDPDSGLVELAFARVHREGSDAGEPPVVNLHGGPGGSSLTGPPTVDSLPLDALEERDLILYDQRGTGRSTPSLNCPEKEKATLAALATANSWEVEFEANEEAALACRKRLDSEGIDLDDYDTPASVEDLETMRRAMGVDTWHVAGRSYGTRLGLAYARAHPEAVRSLLVDSVYAPDVGGVERNQGLPDRAIAALTAACDAQPACLAANGHVDEQLAQAVAAFDADRETITGTVSVGGKDVTREFTLTGADLKGGIFAAQYRSDLIPQLPSIIAGLAAGDRSIVSAFLSTGVPSLLDMSEGVFFSFECADSGAAYGVEGFEDMQADPGDDALYALGTAEPFCLMWDVPEVPAAFVEAVVTDVPTLVFAGTLDPITPYEESKAQAERMPDARLVTVPGAGHGAAPFDDCTRSARDAFWSDPTAELPACLDELTVAPFAT
ncbi:MAG: hypothetical protein JWM47_2902 [Acidimicrobiales bacterium]|nr:hypothetical protein [Acidimicrobiales bacterium]